MWTRTDPASRLALAVALVASISTACSSDTTSPARTNVLMPLTVGSHWSYEWYDSVEFGTAFTPGVVPGGTEVTVLRDTVVAGTTWAIVDGGDEILDYTTGQMVLGNQHDGLYEFLESPGFGLPSLSLRLFPYPTSAGAVFGRNGAGSVSNADTIITVPAGTFHCIRYDLASGWGDTISDTYFIAPQTGVILRVTPPSEAYDGNGQLVGVERLEFRLRSVSLGGG